MTGPAWGAVVLWVLCCFMAPFAVLVCCTIWDLTRDDRARWRSNRRIRRARR